MATNDAPEFAPTVEDYVSAFRKIESQMTEKQRKTLMVHYQQWCKVDMKTRQLMGKVIEQ